MATTLAWTGRLGVLKNLKESVDRGKLCASSTVGECGKREPLAAWHYRLTLSRSAARLESRAPTPAGPKPASRSCRSRPSALLPGRSSTECAGIKVKIQREFLSVDLISHIIWSYSKVAFVRTFQPTWPPTSRARW
jgi:hypothetical protein